MSEEKQVTQEEILRAVNSVFPKFISIQKQLAGFSEGMNTMVNDINGYLTDYKDTLQFFVNRHLQLGTIEQALDNTITLNELIVVIDKMVIDKKEEQKPKTGETILQK